MNKNVSSQMNKRLQSPQIRLYYLDWLRVITIIAVFFHHCSRIFDIRNSYSSTGIIPTLHREFGNLWMMPLIFFISGAVVFYSIQFRKTWKFLKERFLRILLPLLTVGLFVIAPPIVYVEKMISGESVRSFFEWYPLFFKFWKPANLEHLWFLGFLFSYVIISFLFFIPFGKKNISILTRFAKLLKKSWSLLILFILMIAVVPLEIYSNRLAGGWDPLSYLIFFICGYILLSNDEIQKLINRYYMLYTAGAIILTVIYLYFEFSSLFPEIRSYMLTEYNALQSLKPPALTPRLAGFFALRHIAACCWVIALLGLGSRFLNFNDKFLSYANEAVLPFYILHMTIIYVTAGFILRLNVNIGIKYIMTAALSFIIIMLIYEFFVRRNNILRFFFGIKVIKSI